MRVSSLKSLRIIGGGAIFSTPAVLSDMQTAEQEHKSRLWAGAKSAVANNWQYLVMTGWGGLRQLRSFGYLGLLSAAAPMATAVANTISQRNYWIRQAATPFSHRFDHSDWTAAFQQRGMQKIAGVRGLIGSEAAAMNARYMRR